MPPAAAAASGSVVAIAAPLKAGATVESPVVSATAWLHLTRLAWVRWLVLGSAPLVGLGLTVVCGWRSPATATACPIKPQRSPQRRRRAAPFQECRSRRRSAPPVRMARRLAARAHGLGVQRAGVQLAVQPEAEKAIRQFDPQSRVSIGPMLHSLGLTLDSVQRLTWASTDLAAWPQRSVVILELAPGHDTDALAHGGEAADLGKLDLPCRRIPGAAWPHPLLVVDRQTIVTGDETLLRVLARRPAAHLESAPLERLLAAVAPDADAVLLVDFRPGPGGRYQTAYRPGGRVARGKTLMARPLRNPRRLGLHPLLVRSVRERGRSGVRERDDRGEGPGRSGRVRFRRSNVCSGDRPKRCKTPGRRIP